jgi:hypothetical protein
MSAGAILHAAVQQATPFVVFLARRDLWHNEPP